MSVLGLVSGLVGIVSAIISYFADQKKIDGALAMRLNLHLEKVKAEILDAQSIRDTVAARPADELRKSDDGLFRD